MSPPYLPLPTFERDYEHLTIEQRRAFRAAVAKFIADLHTGAFRRGLRVKGVRGAPGVFEMTWAPDGRATFQFGTEIQPGSPHVIWRRIGTHHVLERP